MRLLAALAIVFCSCSLLAQSAERTGNPDDPWQSLRFLQGTWEAKTQGGTAGANSTGTYTFTLELKQHVLARHTSDGEACSGPQGFNCDHHDLLYVYQESNGEPLKAIYFDNEGHVIHYVVSTPEPDKAVFLSDANQAGPRFRLVYQLKDGVMYGQFEMQMKGQTGWNVYLAWKGARR